MELSFCDVLIVEIWQSTHVCYQACMGDWQVNEELRIKNYEW